MLVVVNTKTTIGPLVVGLTTEEEEILLVACDACSVYQATEELLVRLGALDQQRPNLLVALVNLVAQRRAANYPPIRSRKEAIAYLTLSPR